jgi:hypothetical protein
MVAKYKYLQLALLAALCIFLGAHLFENSANAATKYVDPSVKVHDSADEHTHTATEDIVFSFSTKHICFKRTKSSLSLSIF